MDHRQLLQLIESKVAEGSRAHLIASFAHDQPADVRKTSEMINQSSDFSEEFTSDDGRAGVIQLTLEVTMQGRCASSSSRSDSGGRVSDYARHRAGISMPVEFGVAGW